MCGVEDCIRRRDKNCFSRLCYRTRISRIAHDKDAFQFQLRDTATCTSKIEKPIKGLNAGERREVQEDYNEGKRKVLQMRSDEIGVC